MFRSPLKASKLFADIKRCDNLCQVASWGGPSAGYRNGVRHSVHLFYSQLHVTAQATGRSYILLAPTKPSLTFPFIKCKLAKLCLQYPLIIFLLSVYLVYFRCLSEAQSFSNILCFIFDLYLLLSHLVVKLR